MNEEQTSALYSIMLRTHETGLREKLSMKEVNPRSPLSFCSAAVAGVSMAHAAISDDSKASFSEEACYTAAFGV